MIGELFGNKKVKQEFTCSEDNLSRLEIKVATYMRKNKGILRLSLFEKNGASVGYQNFPMESLADNSWLSFAFNNLPKSKGKSYILYIQGINARIGSSVTCYFSHGHDFGKLLLNNTIFKGSLNLKLFSS